MPPRKPNTESQDTDFTRDDKGRFQKRSVQIDQMRQAISRLTKQEEAFKKQVEAATKSQAKSMKQVQRFALKENSLLKGKIQLQNKVTKSVAAQMKLITKSARDKERQLKREGKLIKKNFRSQIRTEKLRLRLSRKGRGGSFGGGIGGLGLGSIASLGLGVAAASATRAIVDARLNTFLNLGRGATQRIGSLGGQGIAPTSKFKLLSGFQEQGVSQFILGGRGGIQEGLLKAQETLAKTVGATTAKELLLSVTRSFGADAGRRRAFLESVQSNGLRSSIGSFQDQQNFREFSRISNALSSPTDPTIQARAEFLDVMESLKSSFEQLVVTVGTDLVPLMEKLGPAIKSVLEFIGGASTGSLVATGAALVGAKVAGGAVIRSLASRVVGTAAAGVAGIGAIGVGSAVLAADQFNRFARGKGTIGSSLTDSLFSLFGFDKRQDAENVKGKRELAKALGITPQELDKKQDAIRERNVQAETKRLSALKLGTKSLQKFAKGLDKAPNAIASQIEKRAELQLPRALAESGSQLQRENLGIARLGLFGGSLGLSEIRDVNKSLTNERDKLSAILETFDQTPTGRLEANKVRTQIAGINREIKSNQIQLQSSELTLASEATNLRRGEFALQRINPLGTIGAFPELKSINKSLRDEIEILQRMAKSAELGPLETIKVKQAILSRDLELRQNQRTFLDAFKDSVVKNALGAGRFSQILFTDTQNVGIALRKGLFDVSKEVSRNLFGNVDPSVTPLMPKTVQEILKFNPFARVPRGVGPPPVRPRVGSHSSESLVNIGKAIIKTAEQMRVEDQVVDNRFAEAITSPSSGRIGVQPLSP